MRETSKEKLFKRIDRIKSGLEAEEKKFGWIRDKRGMRYIPSELYLKMEDYAEALNYMKWFLRHFPKDKGFPEFLLEWTIIHFKNGNLKEAKFKAFETWCANTYIFDYYFGRELQPKEIFHRNENESMEYAKFIHFKSGDSKRADFDQWLENLTQDKKFQKACNGFIEIRKALLIEQTSEKRAELNKKEANLKYDL